LSAGTTYHDNKWFARLAVAGIIWQTMADLRLEFPKVDDEKKKELQEVRRVLMAEDGGR
jgi:hypothetical protein